MTTEGRERCEAAPDTWSLEAMRPRRPPRGPLPPERFERPNVPPPEGGGGPPPRPRGNTRLFAYSPDLTARNPQAPALEASLARTRGPGGHGLGLAIASRVTVLHGWSLKLGRSEYGGLQVDFLGEESAPGQKDA